MNLKSTFENNDRAVSPVIGVILMVAITVILAAVIGTFVLGLGDSLGDNQPTAQLSTDIDHKSGSPDEIVIEHDGGDSIEANNLNVIVNAPSPSNSAEGIIGSRLSVGDSAAAPLTSTADSKEVSSGQDVRIRVVHQPSDSLLIDRTFAVDQDTDLENNVGLSF